MADQQLDEKDAAKGVEDQVYTAEAQARLPLPEAASRGFVWECAGESIEYTATAGHIDVRSDTGSLIGKMFSVSYVASRVNGEAAADRPVTFCYNGGPGSSSVPINLGGVGPKRVATDGTNHLSLPAHVEDNPSTVLRQSDLVFLDALGTGYSAVAEGVDPKMVWGIDGDADAFCRAIIAWLDANGRWGSPVYLFGESYGTIRNAVLMRLLGEKCIPVRGVIMLSAIFDWVQVLPGEDLYYLGMLPTFAATARYFGRAGADTDVDIWFDEAMDFTERVYAPALLRGDRLTEQEMRKTAERIAELIGLPAELIERYNLRVDLDTFRRNLLADDGLVCGRLDTRFTSAAPLPVQGADAFFAGEDAADDAVEPVWHAVFRRHLADIGYQGAPMYMVNNYGKIGPAWNWTHEAPGTGDPAAAPNVAFDIACALKRNPTMRVAILGGRYDAATTYWNVVHDISCLFLPPELKQRVEFKLYSCGHMSYVDVPTLEAMGRDLAEFYAK